MAREAGKSVTRRIYPSSTGRTTEHERDLPGLWDQPEDRLQMVGAVSRRRPVGRTQPRTPSATNQNQGRS